MAVLLDRQWELDGSLLMGRGQFRDGTKYIVGTPEFGEADVRDDPTNAPRADGQIWGRGHRGGRTITLEITVDCYTKAEGRAAAAALEAAWDAESVRSVPGAVSVLRWNWAGEPRRVYGRTGKLAPTSTFDHQGRIDYVAEFNTVDNLYYGDSTAQLVVPFVPAQLGGLIGPQTGGWAATTAGIASGQLSVSGSKPAWLSWTVRGPIQQPTIELVGMWSATLNTTIAYDQAITVEPTPWARGVRRVSDGANFAGDFTATSQRLSQMRVPPGTAQVLLRGFDPTGTSSVTTSVRPAHSTY
ncbi:hypothetical protein EV383_4378 [Pseudonocardia sediminis]|uniref:Uncharacterized protein n=1 Tax=Pseudonocardia sediminis TaxID=1397368 RepID=A0A4Q7V1V3_PSEST|nr:hypothetical protein [Pseudonocardia sediminis]RZT87454.1 hypothetical protein EV383_4378 [Pseudonocardia sediminis]